MTKPMRFNHDDNMEKKDGAQRFKNRYLGKQSRSTDRQRHETLVPSANDNNRIHVWRDLRETPTTIISRGPKKD